MNRVPTILLVASVLLGAGCSEVDCRAPLPYNGYKLGKPLTTPPGLDTPKPNDANVIPGDPPTTASTGGACLVKPPQVVAPPSDKAPAKPAAAPATKP